MKPGEHILLDSMQFTNTAVELGYAGSVGGRAFDTLARYFAAQSDVRTADSVIYNEPSRGHNKPHRALSVPNLALHLNELNPDDPKLKMGDITTEIAHDIVAYHLQQPEVAEDEA